MTNYAAKLNTDFRQDLTLFVLTHLLNNTTQVFKDKKVLVDDLLNIKEVSQLNVPRIQQIASTDTPLVIMESLCRIIIKYCTPILINILKDELSASSVQWKSVMNRFIGTAPLDILEHYHDAVISKNVEILRKLHSMRVVEPTLQAVMDNYPLPKDLTNLLELLR